MSFFWLLMIHGVEYPHGQFNGLDESEFWGKLEGLRLNIVLGILCKAFQGPTRSHLLSCNVGDHEAIGNLIRIRIYKSIGLLNPFCTTIAI